jgi:hypothetical protein
MHVPSLVFSKLYKSAYTAADSILLLQGRQQRRCRWGLGGVSGVMIGFIDGVAL